MASRRRLARIAAMQTVFAMQARGADPSSTLSQNIAEFREEAVDSAFASVLVQGVEKESAVIKRSIEEKAPQWTWDRMDSITRAILLVGGYELLFAKDAPPAVVMNEAIEIAKEYGTEEGAKFVNGVLNALAHPKNG